MNIKTLFVLLALLSLTACGDGDGDGSVTDTAATADTTNGAGTDSGAGGNGDTGSTGGSDTTGGEGGPSLPAGSLLLSEVFEDASGPDDGLQWVELYNTTDAAIDLADYSLGFAGPDYSYSVVQLAGVVGAGQTFVAGGPSSGAGNGNPAFDQPVDFSPDIVSTGVAASGVALFEAAAAAITSATVPIDAVIFGIDNGNGLIDESGAAGVPEVADPPAGSSIERIDTIGHWSIQSHPTPDRVAPGISGSQAGAPAFAADPTDRPGATVGSPYQQSLAGSASDPDGDPLSFTKLSGPAWLVVAADGALSGTPGSADVGLNSFEIRVTDSTGLSATTTLDIVVTTAVDEVVFAVIGDFGTDDSREGDVAAEVSGWNPDFVITVGDNRYSSRTMDAVIGGYYCDFLTDVSSGSRCAGGGSPVNAFFPALGNHDYDDGGGITEYLDYFTLPGAGIQTTAASGSERYYDFVQGPVHFFAIDSAGTNLTTQKTWLQQALADSSAAWNIVYFHHPPYSSSTGHGSQTFMQWSFAEWGADIVMAGHDHTYERIERDGIIYYVNGLGGRSVYGIGTPVEGSQLVYNGDNGAMRVRATDAQMVLEFITRTGALIDSRTLTAP